MNTRLLKAAVAQPMRGLGLRRLVGFAICGLGCVQLLSGVVDQMMHAGPQLRAALVGGGIAAAATGLGTLPVLWAQEFSRRSYDCFLGFGSGVMLGATSFSLVIPALASAKAAGAGAWGASGLVGVGLMAGAALLLLLDRCVTTDGILSPPGVSGPSLKRAWLFVAAVSLHNMPEGLAIGVGYAGIDLEKANSLATGIAIQDVPEGLVVALALRTVGYGRGLSTACGVASGLIEPVAAVVGAVLIGMAGGLLPAALAAAAGAMLFVIVNDVIPESHQSGNGTFASVALVAGFILMTVLDTALS